MLRPSLFAIGFAVLGLVAVALPDPLVASGNIRKLGETILPVVVFVCGAIGFFVDRRRIRP